MNNPRPEFRIKSLENRVTTTEASIEELAEGLKMIRQEIKQGHLDIGKAIDSHAEALMEEIRKRFDHTDQRFAAIEATMATKEDLGKFEARMDRIEATQQRQEQLLQAILDRLPPKQ